MKPIFAAVAFSALIALATTAVSQQPKAQPKAGAAIQTPPRPGTVAGPQIVGQAGIVTCQQWLAIRAQSPAGQAESAAWVAGFLSAINYSGLDSAKNITDGHGEAGAVQGLETDCRASPTAKVADVLWRGVADLLRRKGYNISTLGNTALPKG